MIDFVVPFLLLSVLGAVGVLAFTDFLRRSGRLSSRLAAPVLYLVVLGLIYMELS